MIVNNDSSVVVIRKLPTLRLVEIDNRPVSQQQKDFMPNERAIPGTNLISNIQYWITTLPLNKALELVKSSHMTWHNQS